jgi:hypothetical protein
LKEIDILHEKQAYLPNAVYSIEKFIKRGGNELDEGNVIKRQKILQSNMM